MSIPVPPGGLEGRPSPISDTLERVRVTLGLSQKDYADILDVPEKRYERIKRGHTLLSSHSLLQLASHFQLDAENLFRGDIDYPALAAHAGGNMHHLPERYAHATFSRRRTSINVLGYIEEFFGWRTRAALLKKFQITEAILVDPNAWVNVNLLTDLCNWAHDAKIGEEHLFRMGAYSLISNYRSPLGEAYRSMSSPVEVIERAFQQYISLYDINFFYSLQALSNETATIKLRLNPDLEEAMQTKLVGSAPYCYTKAGVFSSLPGYLGLPFAEVRETHCIHRGDPYCAYEIDFARASRSQRERLNTYGPAGTA